MKLDNRSVWFACMKITQHRNTVTEPITTPSLSLNFLFSLSLSLTKCLA